MKGDMNDGLKLGLVFGLVVSSMIWIAIIALYEKKLEKQRSRYRPRRILPGHQPQSPMEMEMKLDRNINPDGKGKYALINLRTNKVEWGGEDQFFVKTQGTPLYIISDWSLTACLWFLIQAIFNRVRWV